MLSGLGGPLLERVGRRSGQERAASRLSGGSSASGFRHSSSRFINSSTVSPEEGGGQTFRGCVSTGSEGEHPRAHGVRYSGGCAEKLKTSFVGLDSE